MILSSFLVSQLLEMHLPWGAPQGGAGKGGCILTQQDFVTGYSTSLRLPLWVAYKLHGEVRTESFLVVADPGESRGGPPPPLIFRPIKKFFLETAPSPYLRVWMTGTRPPPPPPPPLCLNVRIRHCLVLLKNVQHEPVHCTDFRSSISQ